MIEEYKVDMKETIQHDNVGGYACGACTKYMGIYIGWALFCLHISGCIFSSHFLKQL